MTLFLLTTWAEVADKLVTGLLGLVLAVVIIGAVFAAYFVYKAFGED